MKSNILVIIKRLKKAYPDVKVALNYGNPLEILVATILSAQCTDERVNIVTKTLFKKYRKLEDYAAANLKELEQDVHSTGFYRNKAKNIINSAKLIKKDFKGKVPDTMEEILTLPGVARKTANVVLGVAYGKVEGIIVDTHVIRLSNRLGLTKNNNAAKIEEDLVKLVPKNDWFNISFLIQAHGRKICIARKPRCSECFLEDICPKINVEVSQ
jgi:endonuclease-3